MLYSYLGGDTMKRKEALEARNNVVVKSNDLIQRSRFSLTTQQQRMMLYLISKIMPQDENFKTYQLDIVEFCQTCGIDYSGGKTYEELKASIKALADKSMWIEIEDEKGEAETLIRWIEEPTIRKNSGIVEVQLNKYLKPYLLQLKKNFTSYELIYTLRFRSKYSIRLYELACSVVFHPLQEYRKRYTVEELKKRLGAENYTDYRKFRVKALDVAVREINEYSDKNISYNQISSKGRKIEAIEIVITSKNSIEAAKIRSDTEHELGLDDGQITLFDTLVEKGLISNQ